MRNFLACTTLFLLLFSCDNAVVFSKSQSLHHSWREKEAVTVVFQPTDTIHPHNLFITLRNDEKYPFQNLFLIAHIAFPDGKIMTDTLEYAMATPSGEWLGRGFTSVKENKLWYKENFVFAEPGRYTISIEHAMRENGKTGGMMQLPGIMDVGIKIEKNND